MKAGFNLYVDDAHKQLIKENRQMNFIAVVTTFFAGFFVCQHFIGTDFASVISITVMGYFILRKIDKLNEENNKKKD